MNSEPKRNRGHGKVKASRLLTLFVCFIVGTWGYIVSSMFARVGCETEIRNHDALPVPSSNIAAMKSDSDLASKSFSPGTWPGIPVERLGHPLVKIGTSFPDHMRDIINTKDSDGVTILDKFIEVYKNRPDKVNLCGIQFNHALALFTTMVHLKPTFVVESGVNAGQSTYFIRNALPDTTIWALDPEPEPICGQGTRWIDPSTNTKYWTGDEFRDLNHHNWLRSANRGEFDPESTVVFLDDHQSVLNRMPSLMRAGIKHVIVEDNYKLNLGASEEDKRGDSPKQMFNVGKTHKRRKDAEWFFHNLISYSEFPAFVPPIMSRNYEGERKKVGGFLFHSDTNEDIVAPIFRPDIDDADKKIYEDIVNSLGFDPLLRDAESYIQFMGYNQIAYLELLQMSPQLKNMWQLGF